MTDRSDAAPSARPVASVPSAAPSSVVATAAVAAITVLVLLVAVWAASAGPDEPFRNGGEVVQRSELPPPTPTVSVPPSDGEKQQGQEPEKITWITTVLGLVVLLIGVGVGLGLLYLVGRALWGLRSRGWQRRAPDQDVEVAPLEPAHAVQAVVAAMLADADDHEELLLGGTPRNAVVQCWHRFEAQAEQAGVPRKPWETSSEFTLRLLDLVEADSSSVERLSVLYREARFSEHEVGEDSRVAALEVLRTIHHDLRTLLSGGRL